MASQLNKLAQFVQQNPLAVTQFGAGLLSQPTIGQGVQAGLLGAMQAKQWSDQREEKKKREEQYKKLLTQFGPANGPMTDHGGGITSQNLGEPLQPGQPNQFGITPEVAQVLSVMDPRQGSQVVANAMFNKPKQDLRVDNFRSPDGVVGLQVGSKEWFEAVKNKWPRVGLTTTTDSIEGLYSRKEREKSANNLNTSYGTLSEIDDLLKMAENPNIMHSALNNARKIGASSAGLLNDVLPGDPLKGVENALDPNEDITKFQTQYGMLVSRLIPAITAENSGRYTDTERRIAKEIAGQKNSSKDQMVASLNTIRKIEFRASRRELLKKDGLPDLTSKQAQLDFANALWQSGKFNSKEDVAEYIKGLRDQYNLTDDLYLE